MDATTLIVGIGSPHGDDQAGWLVARKLAERLPSTVTVRIARSPSELLNWLDGVERLIICDACQAGDAAGTIRRWQWPADELNEVRWSSTHDMPLPAALSLAERLEQMPNDVVIWSVEADDTTLISTESAKVSAAVDHLACRIEQELREQPCEQAKDDSR